MVVFLYACRTRNPREEAADGYYSGTVSYRTLFGSFQLPSPRLYRCRCQDTGPRSFSPLAQVLAERTAPELLYLETKWAALIPYRATSELLADVLPLDHAVSTAVLRGNVHKVAQRMEGEPGSSLACPHCPHTTEDQAHSRLLSAITAPQTPR